MNIFALLMLFAVIAAGVIGLAYIGSRTATAPPVDTYGNTTDEVTNASQAAVGNLTATGQQVGGGAILLVAGIIGAVVLGGFLVFGGKSHKSSGRG